MEEEKKDVGVEYTTTDNTGATEATETKKDYEKLSQTDKELQGYVDRKVSEALKTAKANWEESLNTERTEAEKLEKMTKEQKLEYQAQKEKKEKEDALAELNAYKLKEEALKVASEKGLDVSLLNLIDFKTITAEELSTNIDNMTSVFNKAVEKVINERLKEDTPITKTSSSLEKKTISRASY